MGRMALIVIAELCRCSHNRVSASRLPPAGGGLGGGEDAAQRRRGVGWRPHGSHTALPPTSCQCALLTHGAAWLHRVLCHTLVSLIRFALFTDDGGAALCVCSAGGSHPASYSIDVGPDGTTWSSVYNETGGASYTAGQQPELTSFLPSPTSARWLRIRSTGSASVASTVNLVETGVASAGGFGGSCTCPDGQVY
jgi:hypothetical protein